MKRLPVISPSYQYIEQSFKEWLAALGYSWQSVYYMPIQVRGLLHYLESQGKMEIADITAASIKQYYYEELKQRKNHMRGVGALSSEHLNKHLQALRKFTEYLRQTGKLQIAELNIPQEAIIDEKPTVLSEEEIKQLYHATTLVHERNKHAKGAEVYEALQYRDRAMLSIFYGCGLRRNEGYHLNTGDINLDSGVVHVVKGKGYKERFVPVSSKGIKHITEYMYDARPVLLKDDKQEAFFISYNGKRLSGQMLMLCLQSLAKRTDSTELMEKEIGLHTLRHSIATHLLAHGMRLEKIRDFLGHSSLESTQIYTHLVTETYEQV
ncbi:tyrosine-type recombinase/integrase [Sediminibacterium soli]|uniref:tyrosine-type recombinase/integrase n=1 Tax=Sediminibacterium soli TaxID=2698829 RepID=UPI00137972CA|nr:tyrosine-type recombinase/integrase [Sediminibacterium soli]NCI45789.1 tyrosine-type recombinase/integrase [Sediminibacterium soli]